MLVVIVMRISMSLILGRRSLDAGYGRWMLMVCNEYNDDNDDVDGDDGLTMMMMMVMIVIMRYGRWTFLK